MPGLAAPTARGRTNSEIAAEFSISLSTVNLCNETVAQHICCIYAVGMSTSTDADAAMDEAFAALGDRTRRAILVRLARGEATVGELAEPFDLTHQAISRHVGVLRRCGLIHQRVDGPRRPCRLNVERMGELAGWIAEQQREWASRLDLLDDHLGSLQAERT